MVNFLVEISKREKVTIHATPSNSVNRQNNIYEIDIGESPESSYWRTKWGGKHNAYTGVDIELFFSEYLRHLDSLEEVKRHPFSLCIVKNIVYINIPNHPWLYPMYTQGGFKVYYFLYSVLNPDKPSNNIIDIDRAETRLELPNFNVKLSEEISGISLHQSFSIQLQNDDGYFDNDDDWLLHNTPVTIRKSVVDNPQYEHFNPIRNGLVEDTEVDFETFSIDVADKLKMLENDVCSIITKDSFPYVPNLEKIDESAIDKKIPIVFGTKKIEPIKLAEYDYNGETQYFYLLAEYVYKVIDVYNKNGHKLRYSIYENVIRVTSVIVGDDEKDDDLEVDYAIVTGYYDYNYGNNAGSVGAAILYIMRKKAGMIFDTAFWDTMETQSYLYNSMPINMTISSGNVKKALQDILKNDSAYLIQKNNGKFSIRKWGMEYGHHTIPTWCITQKPKKDYSTAYERYFSSCIIKYSTVNGDGELEYHFEEKKEEALKKYNREKIATFETNIADIASVKNLAALLSNRYSTMRQTLQIAVGIDTSGFELLDRVTIDMTINGREFSKIRNFVIKEINPAQDILVLEEIKT